VAHQPAISSSISIHFPFNRAGGRTSNVRQKLRFNMFHCCPRRGVAFGHALLVAFAALSMTVRSAVVTIYWSGAITKVDDYGGVSIPSGLTVGNTISGDVSFETTSYTTEHGFDISDVTGRVYSYDSALSSRVYVAGTEWVIIRLIRDHDKLEIPRQADV
jgi:hypothetical protein